MFKRLNKSFNKKIEHKNNVKLGTNIKKFYSIVIIIIIILSFSFGLIGCTNKDKAHENANNQELISQIINDSADKMAEIIDRTHNINNKYGMDYYKYYGTIKNQTPYDQYIEYLRENLKTIDYNNKEQLIIDIANKMAEICDNTHQKYGMDYYKYSNTIKGQYPYEEFKEYLENKLK